MNRTAKLVIAGLLAALVVLGWLAWSNSRSADQAKRQIGLDATRMVAEVFRAKRELRVGQLNGVVVARSEHDGTVFHPTQQTRAPASVDYLLKLQDIRDRDLAWDPQARRMIVRIPDISVEPPNVDMARAEVLQQDGVWISRQAGRELTRQAAERIAVRADQRARDEANMRNARAAAENAVRQMVRQPLVAAGLGNVEVDVRWPWQGMSTERMDASRSLEDVYANRY